MCSSAAPSHEPGSRSPLTASSPMFSAVSATERSLRKYTTFFFSFPVSAAVHCSSFEPSSTKTRRLSGSERKSSSGRPPSSEASSFLNFSGLHLRPRHTAASSQPVAGAEGAPSAIAQLPGGFCADRKRFDLAVDGDNGAAVVAADELARGVVPFIWSPPP